MENKTLSEITYLNRKKLFTENTSDFISENLLEEELIYEEELKKRKLTLVSLGSIYILLLLVSFTLLT